jgi:hypothetical protein
LNTQPFLFERLRARCGVDLRVIDGVFIEPESCVEGCRWKRFRRRRNVTNRTGRYGGVRNVRGALIETIG